MSASNKTKLTGDIPVWGKNSLQDLVDKADILVKVLKVFSMVLQKKHAGRFAPPKPAIFREFVRARTNPEAIAKQLDLILDGYEPCLDWLKSLRLKAAPNKSWVRKFVLEASSAQWLESRPILSDDDHELDPEAAALKFFNWTALWVADVWSRGNPPKTENQDSNPGGYWPRQEGPGLSPEWGPAGSLALVDQDKTESVIESFCNPQKVSQNGWPHPLATSEHFRFQVRHDYENAQRRLAILWCGLAL